MAIRKNHVKEQVSYLLAITMNSLFGFGLTMVIGGLSSLLWSSCSLKTGDVDINTVVVPSGTTKFVITASNQTNVMIPKYLPFSELLKAPFQIRLKNMTMYDSISIAYQIRNTNWRNYTSSICDMKKEKSLGELTYFGPGAVLKFIWHSR